MRFSLRENTGCEGILANGEVEFYKKFDVY